MALIYPIIEDPLEADFARGRVFHTVCCFGDPLEKAIQGPSLTKYHGHRHISYSNNSKFMIIWFYPSPIVCPVKSTTSILLYNPVAQKKKCSFKIFKIFLTSSVLESLNSLPSPKS
uniref:Uncharacterized protein n=1 Tax=Nelumbo nucifera TaxID=4432 RepID=A0A822YR09_NELNU|nr:TPA_asm: hypothetical protein HUJ06_005610 [Nelumbo nucifera]